MKPGKLRKTWGNDSREATVGPDGWASSDAWFADHLNAIYPVGGSPAGVPWVRAFHEAVNGLKATAVVEPEPDPSPPGTIH